MRVRGLHPVSAIASAAIATQSRTRLRLRPRHRRMPVPPPKDENHYRHGKRAQPNPSRRLMSHLHRAIQLVAHQVADELYRAMKMAHQASRWIGLGAFAVAIVIFVFWWRDRHPAVSRPQS